MNKTKQQKNQSQLKTILMLNQQIQLHPKSSYTITKPSLLASFIAKLCPCVYSNNTNQQKNNTGNIITHQQTKTSIHTKNSEKSKQAQFTKKNEPTTVETLIQQRKKNIAFSSLHEIEQKLPQQNYVSKSTIKKWNFYPTSLLKQEQLITVGNLKSTLLCKIKSIRIQPSIQSKNLTKKSKKYQTQINSSYSRSYLDKYWHKRYYLFSKFDQGISLAQNSWPVVIPQAVSQHIASKIKYDTVLNMCCGVGGDAIKLANTCNKVIAYDCDINNLKCVQINKKIYGVQNLQILDKLQFKSTNLQPHAVIISSYSKLQQQCLSKTSISLSSFHPSLSQLIKKSLNFTSNMILILPANINLSQFAKLLTSQLQQQNIKPQTCCIKVQKIFYLSQFKYIVIYFGEEIGRSLAINDQLLWIYRKLGIQTKGIVAKKFIKKLRQQYGMVKLLNFVLQAIQEKQNDQSMVKLFKFIKNNKLFNEEKLNKLVQQYKKQISKQQSNKTSNQQNKQQDSQQYKQKTVSDVSESSVNRVSTDQIHINIQSQNDPFQTLTLQLKDQSRPRSLIVSKNKPCSAIDHHFQPNGINCFKKEKQLQRKSSVQQYINK